MEKNGDVGEVERLKQRFERKLLETRMLCADLCRTANMRAWAAIILSFANFAMWLLVVGVMLIN